MWNTNVTKANAKPELLSHAFGPYKQSKADNGRPPRCLIIDNDSDTLEYLDGMLSILGCRVDMAENKTDAMAKLTAGAYDLIVAELNVPEMNTCHLAIRIKTKHRATKIIIMTDGYKDDCVDMLATGWADGWMLKPFGMGEMRDMIEELGLLSEDF